MRVYGVFRRLFFLGRMRLSSFHASVHSANRYQIAHLLEHGHAKRGGGRVAARPQIAAAEEKGIRDLEDRIKEGLSGWAMKK